MLASNSAGARLLGGDVPMGNPDLAKAHCQTSVVIGLSAARRVKETKASILNDLRIKIVRLFGSTHRHTERD